MRRVSTDARKAQLTHSPDGGLFHQIYKPGT